MRKNAFLVLWGLVLWAGCNQVASESVTKASLQGLGDTTTRQEVRRYEGFQAGGGEQVRRKAVRFHQTNARWLPARKSLLLERR